MNQPLSKIYVREPKIEYGEMPTEDSPKVNDARTVARVMREFCANHPFFDPEIEHFFVISCTTKNKIKGINLVCKGVSNGCPAPTSETFRFPVLLSAPAMIIAHNHPSGEVIPSRGDDATTKRFVDAAKIMGIELLDHIIFTADNLDYYSFNENGRT